MSGRLTQCTQVKELFELYDKDKDDSLDMNELAAMLQDIGNKITSLPAVRFPYSLHTDPCSDASQTAQVASQQGKYIGSKLYRLAKREASLTKNMVSPEAADEFVSKPFCYHHLGSLAYIGNAAVFDFGKYSFMGGLVSPPNRRNCCLSRLMTTPPIHSGPCTRGDPFTSVSR